MQLRASIAGLSLIFISGLCLTTSAREVQPQSFDALLLRRFSKTLNLEARDFQALPVAQRHEIAAAAARELSLRTADGTAITADVVDERVFLPRALDSPEQARLMRLHQSNRLRMYILRMLTEARLITEPSVIGPLIEMLDYPGRSLSTPSDAMSILTQLTRIEVGVRDFDWGGRSTPEKRREMAGWWRTWWQRNQDKHPVFDSELQECMTARIAAIVMRLRRDFADYPNISHLDPYSIRVPYDGPLIAISVDTRNSSVPSIVRRAPDGTMTYARGAYIALNIHARFANPPRTPDGVRGTDAVGALQETLPGSDILISVHASSDDPEFAKQMAVSMKGLDPTPTSAAEAKSALEAFRQSEIARLTPLMNTPSTPTAAAGVARDLVVLRAEAPVVEALKSPDAAIRRVALQALADERVGGAAVEALAGLLQADDPETRRLAAWALGRAKSAPTIAAPALVTAASDASVSIRVTALQALTAQKLPLATAVPVLINGLSDDAPFVRQAAVSGLAEVCRFAWEADGNVFPALMKLLDDPDERTRLGAISATGGLLEVRLRGWFAGGVQDKSAARAFVPRAKVLVSMFIQMLSEPNVSVRRSAARVLAEAGPVDAETDATTAAALIKGLNDDDQQVRGSSMRGLGALGRAAAGAEPTLRLLASSSDANVRYAATSSADRIRSEVYKARLDVVLAEKQLRLTSLAAPIWRAATTKWVNATHRLPGITGLPQALKTASYRARVNMPEAREVDIDFLAFKTERGRIWIGWEMDFYVETDTTLLGGMLSPGGTVKWHTTIAEPAAGDLDAAIREFDVRVGRSIVKGESDARTFLGDADRTYFFMIPGAGQPVLPLFVSVRVEGEQARLVLDNRETGRTRAFWIDLVTRRVVRVEGQ